MVHLGLFPLCFPQKFKNLVPGDALSTLLAKLAQSSQIGEREKEAARHAGLLMANAHELEPH